MQVSTLDKNHEGLRLVQSVAYPLRDLADALQRVGNNKVADELLMYAADIDEGVKMIRSAIGEALVSDLRQAEEQTSLLLKAVLVGALGPAAKELINVDAPPAG